MTLSAPFRAICEGLRLLPVLAGNRVLALRWLVQARAAQVALLLFVLLVPTTLPPLLDSLVDSWYPPIHTEKRIFGPIRVPTTRLDPRRDERRQQLLVGAWSGGLACVALLLLGAAPGVVGGAARESREHEERGDSLLERSPVQSLELYRSALSLASDPRRRAALAEKLHKASEASERGRSLRVPPEPGPARSWSIEALASPQASVEAATFVEAPEPPGAAPPAPRVGPATGMGPNGRYQLREELGRGGMGVVYAALDTALDRPLALKELPHHLSARSDLARRFRQEARLLARLSHPNIVQVYDLIEGDERLWIAMELVDGGTLADAIERDGALPWREAVQLATPLAAGLAFAHRQGVIHRDVKPINILLTRDGVPKISDFGLAKLLEATVHTQEGSLLGSARYMSPEQAAGEPADARSDIYSLGVTFYEMLCGRAPFEGQTASVLAQHLTQEPRRLDALVAGLPPLLESLVMAMLAKQPERRPADLDSVLGALCSLAT